MQLSLCSNVTSTCSKGHQIFRPVIIHRRMRLKKEHFFFQIRDKIIQYQLNQIRVTLPQINRIKKKKLFNYPRRSSTPSRLRCLSLFAGRQLSSLALCHRSLLSPLQNNVARLLLWPSSVDRVQRCGHRQGSTEQSRSGRTAQLAVGPVARAKL